MFPVGGGITWGSSASDTKSGILREKASQRAQIGVVRHLLSHYEETSSSAVQGKDERKPVQADSLALRLWRQIAYLNSFVAVQPRKMYLPFWTSVSPFVNGNKTINDIIEWL